MTEKNISILDGACVTCVHCGKKTPTGIIGHRIFKYIKGHGRVNVSELNQFVRNGDNVITSYFVRNLINAGLLTREITVRKGGAGFKSVVEVKS